jgi:hypothetical protein
MNRGCSCAAAGICLCIGGFLLAAVPGAAAERPGGQAIQFGIAGNFTLGNFAEATLAYQRFISPDVAWRVGLGVNLGYEQSDISVKRTEPAEPSPFSGSRDGEEWNHTVAVGSEFLWYRGSAVALFFGAGPRVSYATYQYDYWDYDVYAGDWSHFRERNGDLAAGVQGCLGVQWAAVKWLALHAEYDARAMYHRRVYEDDLFYPGNPAEHSNDKTTTDEFLLDSRGVRFGLSVYL